MFSVVDRLDFRLNKTVLGVLLDPPLVANIVENPVSITKIAEGEYSVVVRRLTGQRKLNLKSSSDGGGGSITCYDGDKPRWVYTVSWSSLPASASAELTLKFDGYDGGLKGRAKRLIDELKAHVLNGDIDKYYSSILDYFKSDGPVAKTSAVDAGPNEHQEATEKGAGPQISGLKKRTDTYRETAERELVNR